MAEEILAAEAARYAAMLAGDAATLGELLDAALVYTHSDGSRDDRASYLEKVAAGHFFYRRIEHPVDGVIDMGESVAVLGRMFGEVCVAGEERSLANASLAVYRRADSLWRLVAYQPTPLQAQPGALSPENETARF